MDIANTLGDVFDVLGRDESPPVRTPFDMLTGIVRVLDPAAALVTSGKVESFTALGAPVVTQADATKRAAYVDAYFNGRPAARFNDINDACKWYALGDLSALTQGEVFVVLRNEYSAGATPSGDHTGLWHMSGDAPPTHYPFTDSTTYDGFGHVYPRYVFGGTPPLNRPHILNVTCKANGDYAMRIHADDGAHTIGTGAGGGVGFPALGIFGKSNGAAGYTVAYQGWLGYFALCSSVQSDDARDEMIAYLRTRYGV